MRKGGDRGEFNFSDFDCVNLSGDSLVRNRLAMLTHIYDVQRDEFPGHLERFFNGITARCSTVKCRDLRRPRLCILIPVQYNGVAHYLISDYLIRPWYRGAAEYVIQPAAPRTSLPFSVLATSDEP